MAIDERLFYAMHGIDIEKARLKSKIDILDRLSDEIKGNLYVDSLIFTALYDFKNGKIDVDEVIDKFNHETITEVLKIIEEFKKESEEETVTEFADKCRECGSIIGRNLKQKTGRWLSHREYCENHDLIPSGLVTLEWCSNCDFGIDIREMHGKHYNYCPMCGAKMEV